MPAAAPRRKPVPAGQRMTPHSGAAVGVAANLIRSGSSDAELARKGYQPQTIAAARAKVEPPEPEPEPTPPVPESTAVDRPRPALTADRGSGDAAGFLLGLLGMAVAINYLRGGPAQVSRWARAKLLNDTGGGSTSGASSKPAKATGPAAGSGVSGKLLSA